MSDFHFARRAPAGAPLDRLDGACQRRAHVRSTIAMVTSGLVVCDRHSTGPGWRTDDMTSPATSPGYKPANMRMWAPHGMPHEQVGRLDPGVLEQGMELGREPR